MKRNNYIDYLKGLAIITVITIHSISSFNLTHNQSDLISLIANVVNQLGRPAVPLFVALSGYVLYQSALSRPLTYIQFIKRRAFSLLPLYLLWSAFIPIILSLYPEWQGYYHDKPWWTILFFGRADYHLYFVPMIFGLYLVFPIILNFFQKNPKITLISGLLIQVIVYTFILSRPTLKYFHFDQQFYLLPLSWIFYFILGMWLSRFQLTYHQFKFSIILTLIGAIVTILEGELLKHIVLDEVFSALTTRLSVILYSTGLISSLLYIKCSSSYKNKLFSAVASLGIWSYLIYMIHTIFLRILQEMLQPATAFIALQAPIIAYLVGIILSIKLSTRKA